MLTARRTASPRSASPAPFRTSRCSARNRCSTTCGSAATPKSRGDFVSDALRLPWVRRQEAALTETAWSLLELLELEEVACRPVGGTAARHAQAGRAGPRPRRRPKLLLLDEPAGGLNHEEVGELGALIRRMRDEREVTVLLVEHHMNLVMSVSDKVVALDFGRKIAEGTPAEVQQDEDGDPRLSRHRPARPRMMLEVAGLDACYGQTAGAARRQVRRRRGPDPHAAGRQRRRQDDGVAGAVRDGADRRRHHASTTSASRAGRPRTSCGWASPMSRRGAAPSCG